MRRYLENKDFIPRDFYKRYKDKQAKRERLILIVMLIINIILFLSYTERIYSKKLEKDISCNKSCNQKYFELSKIRGLVELAFDERIEKIEIHNNYGEVILNDIKFIKQFENNSYISVNNITKHPEGKYEVNIVVN